MIIPYLHSLSSVLFFYIIFTLNYLRKCKIITLHTYTFRDEKPPSPSSPYSIRLIHLSGKKLWSEFSSDGDVRERARGEWQWCGGGGGVSPSSPLLPLLRLPRHPLPPPGPVPDPPYPHSPPSLSLPFPHRQTHTPDEGVSDLLGGLTPTQKRGERESGLEGGLSIPFALLFPRLFCLSFSFSLTPLHYPPLFPPLFFSLFSPC